MACWHSIGYLLQSSVVTTEKHWASRRRERRKRIYLTVRIYVSVCMYVCLYVSFLLWCFVSAFSYNYENKDIYFFIRSVITGNKKADPRYASCELAKLLVIWKQIFPFLKVSSWGTMKSVLATSVKWPLVNKRQYLTPPVFILIVNLVCTEEPLVCNSQYLILPDVHWVVNLICFKQPPAFYSISWRQLRTGFVVFTNFNSFLNLRCHVCKQKPKISPSLIYQHPR